MLKENDLAFSEWFFGPGDRKSFSHVQFVISGRSAADRVTARGHA